MTTVGDVDDFRHFLPRILELLLSGDLAEEVDPEIVLGKLSYGNWLEWPSDERATVHQFLNLLWKEHRRGPDATNWLCGIARVEPSIREYLDAWEQDAVAQASFAEFLAGTTTKCTGFWEDAPYQWRELVCWRAERQARR